MSTIKIDSFGGLAPSVSERELRPGMAAESLNLFAPSNEFRPLANDRTVAFTLLDSNPQTLYKRQRIVVGGPYTTETEGWYTAPGLVSLVKGQIDDDATERIYLTHDNGSSAPVAWDIAGGFKLLGVTPPAAAPTVVLNAAYKYTVAEDLQARTAIPIQLTKAAQDSATMTMIGTSPTTMLAGAADGWLVAGTAVSAGVLPAKEIGEWAYCAKMTSGANGLTVAANFMWMTDASLRGTQITYGGSIYWAIPVLVQGYGYLINDTLLAAKLREVAHPDPDFVRTDTTGYTGYGATTPAKQLAPDADCLASAQQIKATYAFESEPQKSHIAAVYTAQSGVVDAVSEYGKGAPLVVAMKNFYAGSTVTADINAAITTFAAKVDAATQTALDADAGTWTAATFMGTLTAEVIARFPSAFTVAGIGSNPRLGFFDTDGSLSVKKDAVRSDLLSLLTTRLTGTLEQIASRTTAVNSVMSVVDGGPLSALVAAVSRTTMEKTYPDFPLTAETSRLSAVISAIATLRSAVRTVNEDYNTHNAALANTIANIFDAPSGIAAGLPEPVSAIYDTRVYLTTWVTSWLEESAPSLHSELIEKIDIEVDTCTVTQPATPTALEGVAGWRLYRSNSGSDKTAFQLVAAKQGTPGAVFYGDTFVGFSVATTTFTDDLKAQELAETLPSLTWLKPPANLRGMTGMANGMMAGFYDSTVCFCEPYVPYAWPVEYQITVKYPVVGIASFGSNLVVLTRGSPYMLSGSDSASVSAVEMPSNQACISQRSIVAVENGVLYVSPDGVCYVDASGVQLITQGLITRETWQTLAPATIFAAYHEGVYYMRNNVGANPCLALDMVAKKLTTLDLTAAAFFIDKNNDTLYAASGTTLKAIFGGTGRRVAVYKTGLITLGRQEPFAWLQVFSDFAASISVEWWADGALRHTANVTSLAPLRLPAGRYLEHQIKITSAAKITRVVLCGSTVELQQV